MEQKYFQLKTGALDDSSAAGNLGIHILTIFGHKIVILCPNLVKI